jgi:hypothetical protein
MILGHSGVDAYNFSLAHGEKCDKGSVPNGPLVIIWLCASVD